MHPEVFKGILWEHPRFLTVHPNFNKLTVDIPYTMHPNYAGGRGREAAERTQAAGGLGPKGAGAQPPKFFEFCTAKWLEITSISGVSRHFSIINIIDRH